MASSDAPTARAEATAALHQRLRAETAPPSVLVAENHDILHLCVTASPYLRHPGGPPTRNLLEAVRPALRPALHRACHQALRHAREVETEPVRVDLGGTKRRVRLRVRPVPETAGFYVTFEALPERSPPPEGEADDARQALAEELDRTQARLRATIADHQASHEKLQTANEELRLMNEELRSIAEELGTSNEEAQLAMEEVRAANEALRQKVEELDQARGDLENLMVATEIATLFLDRRLCVQRFTPHVRAHFPLLQADVGRPLAHLAATFDGVDLLAEAGEVLRTLAVKEREVQGAEGRWHLLRLRPYRSLHERIEGVVITFVEITEQKRLQAEIQQARAFAEMIVDSVPEPLLVLDRACRVRSANETFYRTFRTVPEETEGRKVYDLGNGQWDIPRLRALLEEVLPENDTFSGFEVEHDFERIGRRTMRLSGQRLDDVPLILLAIKDVTEEKQAVEALRQSEERFRVMAETVPSVLFTGDDHAGCDYVNARFAEWTGVSHDEALGRGWRQAIHPDDLERTNEALRHARRTGAPYAVRFRLRAAAGAYRWCVGRATPIHDATGRAMRWCGTITDVHDLKEAEEALRRHRDELRVLNATLEARVDERTRQVRRLAAALTLAEQRERHRIARILHDDLQQLLYGLEMTLSHLQKPASAEEAAHLHAQADEILGRAAAVTRTLASELAPSVLQSPNLEDMLAWLALRSEKQHGLQLHAQVQGTCEVPDADLRVLLYQLVRELLFNVARHAGVDQARIVAWAAGGRVHVCVEDEGRGFDVAASRKASQGTGLGLGGIQERLELLGGQVTIVSAPDQGARVTIVLPVQAPGTDAETP